MKSPNFESLFSNILFDEVIDICIDDLLSEGDMIENFDREILTVVVHESFLIFPQQPCRQIDSIAVGPPLGLLLADAFICNFEKE